MSDKLTKELRKAVIMAAHIEFTNKDLQDVLAFNLCIHLDEVMIALHEKADGQVFGANYSHGDFETFWITVSDGSMGYISEWLCEWDLRKDLEGQSQKTKEILLSTLTKTKNV